MKRLTYSTAIVLCLLSAQTIFSQDIKSIVSEANDRDPFKKKFRMGISFNSYWSGIKGSELQQRYFFKPSLGGAVRAEYYIKQFIGVAAGVGFQQGGAGIINKDNTGGAYSHPWVVDKNGNRGDVDSTYLEKLRFSSIEIPLSLTFRTPRSLGDFRLSGGAGMVFVHNFKQNEAWLDVAGGQHSYHFVSSYVKNDIQYQLALGTDINAGDQNSILQLHFVYQHGLKNVYAGGPWKGNEIRLGLRVTWLF